MQESARGTAIEGITVASISSNGGPRCGQMSAYLVGSPCKRPEAQQSPVGLSTEETIAGLCVTAWSMRNRATHQALLSLDAALRHREIAFFGTLKALAPSRSTTESEEPTGLNIQALLNMQSSPRPAEEVRSRVGSIWMSKPTGGLIEQQQIFILVDDLRFYTGRRRRHI